MTDARNGAAMPAALGPDRRGGIVRRYFLIFVALVGGSLAASVLVELAFQYEETRQNLETVHHQMAELAAVRIQNYVEGISQAMTTAAPPRQLDKNSLTSDYAFNLRTLIRSVPAIRDVFAVGPDGHEEFRESRIAPSVPNASADHSSEPFFTAARYGRTYFGPVVFPQDSLEPRIVVAVPIEAFPGEIVGALAADVNVRYVWEVVQDIHFGKSGYAYVVSGDGILVAHPDLHLVLQRQDLSGLPQVADLRAPGSGESGTGVYRNLGGQRVLVSYQRIPNIGWTVLVEQPLMEAYAPALASLARTAAILLAACVLAVAAGVRLARRVVRPIEVLRRGAERLGAGDLDARLHLETGDEFEELAEDFNRMAARLEEARAGLEQKVAERTQALEQSNKALQLASLHKSQFLANMSHELRTPMNAILGFTDLMLDGIYGEIDGRLRKPVEQLQGNGQHLLRLINDVLDLSKIEAGRLDLNLAEYSVDEILEALEATARPLAQAKSLVLRVSTDGRIGHCYGDSKRMFQVLVNLAGNAIKFTRQGGVTIAASGANGEIHYMIQDTGVGIPPDELPLIFEEFGRGDPAVAREFSGTGLGLAIAKRFVSMHHGRIWAESTPMVGSTFHVVVPRRVTGAEAT